MDGSNHKRFVSTKQMGDLLGVTRQTVRNWCVKGEIQAFKIGQNLKISRSEAVRVLVRYHLPVPSWLSVEVGAPARDTKPPMARGRPSPPAES